MESRVTRVRRCAAHQILMPNGDTLDMGVVEVQNGEVVGCYALQGEPPMTEWLGGKIEIKPDDNGVLRAYHQGQTL